MVGLRRLNLCNVLRIGAVTAFAVLLAVQSAITLAHQATPASPAPASTVSRPLPPAWLEFGPEGTLLARVLTTAGCPAITHDGIDTEMAKRSTPTAAFPVVACEANVPFGVASASIAGQSLPLPHGQFQRIAVIGDTGCRLSDWDKKYQNCNDPAAWPFAQVARSVANWRPDLIIHVGDYLYREAACPPDIAGCQGSPFGDNWSTWNADFFTPAAPLLGVAPWVLMRGNHETCSRNPDGWFAYLDPRGYNVECRRFTNPYVIPMVGMAIAVIDSAEASDTTDFPEEVNEYRTQFAALAEMAPTGAWLVTHRPMWGILEGKSGEFQVENASYQAATGGSLKAEYGMILSGHIHLAESLSFVESSNRPPQLIAGNAGTTLDDVPTASPTAGQLGDPDIQATETLSSFGFMTMEPDGSSWIAVQRNAAGEPLIRCTLSLPEIACESANSTG